eukprot:1159992-Pelagomonas_calceolata.AAC.1
MCSAWSGTEASVRRMSGYRSTGMWKRKRSIEHEDEWEERAVEAYSDSFRGAKKMCMETGSKGKQTCRCCSKIWQENKSLKVRCTAGWRKSPSQCARIRIALSQCHGLIYPCFAFTLLTAYLSSATGRTEKKRGNHASQDQLRDKEKQQERSVAAGTVRDTMVKEDRQVLAAAESRASTERMKPALIVCHSMPTNWMLPAPMGWAGAKCPPDPREAAYVYLIGRTMLETDK